MSPLRHFFVSVVLAYVCQMPAWAETAPYPPQRPALTVQLDDGQRLTFSLDRLQGFPRSTVRLRASDGSVHEWSGVRLDAFLESVPGAQGRTLRVKALNNYSVIIPSDDILHYQPLIAFQRDGRFMAIRDYGPLYLIYPFDDHPGLHQQRFYNRSVWQLSEILIE